MPQATAPQGRFRRLHAATPRSTCSSTTTTTSTTAATSRRSGSSSSSSSRAGRGTATGPAIALWPRRWAQSQPRATTTPAPRAALTALVALLAATTTAAAATTGPCMPAPCALAGLGRRQGPSTAAPARRQQHTHRDASVLMTAAAAAAAAPLQRQQPATPPHQQPQPQPQQQQRQPRGALVVAAALPAHDPRPQLRQGRPATPSAASSSNSSSITTTASAASGPTLRGAAAARDGTAAAGGGRGGQGPAATGNGNGNGRAGSGSGNGMTWKVCGGGPPGAPMLSPDSVTLAPDPPHHGRTLAVNVSGATPVSAEGGRLRVAVAYLGFTVYTYDSALCDAMACPLVAGSPFELRVSQKLPALAPPGPYQLQITGEDAGGRRFMCVSLSFSVTAGAPAGVYE